MEEKNEVLMAFIVEKLPDGTILFNWHLLPENLKNDIELRDKIFKELQDKYKIDEFFDHKHLYEANLYVINRIKEFLKEQKKTK